MGARFPGLSAIVVNQAYGGGAFNSPLAFVSGFSPTYDAQTIVVVWSLKYISGATGPIGSYDIRRGPAATDTLITQTMSITEPNASGIYRSGVCIDTVSGIANATYRLFHNITNAATAYNWIESVITVFSL